MQRDYIVKRLKMILLLIVPIELMEFDRLIYFIDFLLRVLLNRETVFPCFLLRNNTIIGKLRTFYFIAHLILLFL